MTDNEKLERIKHLVGHIGLASSIVADLRWVLAEVERLQKHLHSYTLQTSEYITDADNKIEQLEGERNTLAAEKRGLQAENAKLQEQSQIDGGRIAAMMDTIEKLEAERSRLAILCNNRGLDIIELQAKNKQLRKALELVQKDAGGYCRSCAQVSKCTPDCYIALALKED